MHEVRQVSERVYLMNGGAEVKPFFNLNMVVNNISFSFANDAKY